MRLLFLATGPIAAALVFVACGGQVTQTQTSSTGGSGGEASSTSSSSTSGSTSSSGSSSTSSSSSSSTSSSGGGSHGDCQTDADCKGGPCMPITPGGYKVCLSSPDEATMCQNPGAGDECCTTADCPSGAACYAGIDLQFCGGAFPAGNRCVADACQSDADCGAQGICAPAGTFGLPKRMCVTAYCHVDADCKAKPGGICALVGENPCCNHPSPDGLGCVYPGGCEKNAACPGGACDIDPATGTSGCGPAGPGCPP